MGFRLQDRSLKKIQPGPLTAFEDALIESALQSARRLAASERSSESDRMARLAPPDRSS